jgi:hypothetical protein
MYRAKIANQVFEDIGRSSKYHGLYMHMAEPDPLADLGLKVGRR